MSEQTWNNEIPDRGEKKDTIKQKQEKTSIKKIIVDWMPADKPSTFVCVCGGEDHSSIRLTCTRAEKETINESTAMLKNERRRETHLGLVSASVTWRMKMASSGWLMSPFSCMYEEAMASMVPSLLKASEAMLVGYRWNWHRRFLLNGSQMLTKPSEPPGRSRSSRSNSESFRPRYG